MVRIRVLTFAIFAALTVLGSLLTANGHPLNWPQIWIAAVLIGTYMVVCTLVAGGSG